MAETVIILILLFIGLFYTDTISATRFINPDDGYLLALKEKDYDFLLAIKYGEEINANNTIGSSNNCK